MGKFPQVLLRENSNLNGKYYLDMHTYLIYRCKNILVIK